MNLDVNKCRNLFEIFDSRDPHKSILVISQFPVSAWYDMFQDHTYAEACLARIKVPELLKGILGKTGENIYIEAPFHCDYGWNIEVGENFFANYNLTILDVGKVIIGKNAQIAPNVSIYTAGHPVHPDSRNTGYEYGIPITIEDNVWIGGNAVILPGVTIGNNVIIGAGSVVSKDIPDNMIAVGNPCKLIREITEDDRKYFYKNKEFDVSIE